MTYNFARKVCCKRAVQLYEIRNHQKAYDNRESQS